MKEELPRQEDGTYGEITTIKDHLGREPSLPREVEQVLKMYLEHCRYIGVPRSRGRCARDIQEMVIQEHLPVRQFVYNKPGSHIRTLMSIFYLQQCY